MIIRQATEADLSLLTVLFDEYRQFYGSSSDLKQTQQFLQKRFKNQQSIIFVSQKDDVITGFIALYSSFSAAECAEYLILDDTYVTPAYRRQGAAHQLIDTAILYARQKQVLRISLQSIHSNVAAKTLYEKLGFVKDTEFDTYHCFI